MPRNSLIFLLGSVAGAALLSPVVAFGPSQGGSPGVIGETSGGIKQSVGVGPSGGLNVEIAGPMTGFGALSVAGERFAAQVDFPYAINTDQVAVVTTNGTVTHANSMALLQTSAAANSSAEIRTLRRLNYKPGQGAKILCAAIFSPGVAGSTQIVGGGNETDGLFFGYNGATFGALHRNGGSDTWHAQADWNIDPMDGSGPSGQTLDPTKGNIYHVQFQWLGFGRILYGVEDGATGAIVPVHQICLANATTETSLVNPSFPAMAKVENTTNATNVQVKVPGLAVSVEGATRNLGPRNSADNAKAGIGTTLTNVLTIRSKESFGGIGNQVPVDVLFCGASTDGNKVGRIELVLNATIGGSPSWVDVRPGTSVMEVDVAGTTVTGGAVLMTIPIGRSDSKIVDLTNIEIQLQPGDRLTLAAHTTAGGTNEFGGALTWAEDF